MSAPKFSFEFYPPKNLSVVARAVSKFKLFKPRFFDVAYGAGGTDKSDHENMRSASKTMDTANTVIRNADGISVMVHTPATRFSYKGFGIFFKRLVKAGIRHLVVMSGDGQQFHTGENEGDRPGYASSESLLKALPDFQKQYANDNFIDVTVVVEPEMPDPIGKLKKKIAAISKESGGRVRVTQAIAQYSYDPSIIVKFLKEAEEANLGITIVAGVMPHLKKPVFTQKKWPPSLSDELNVPIKPGVLERYKDIDENDPRAVADTGMGMTIEMLQALKSANVKHIHFYGANAHRRIIEAIAKVWPDEFKLEIEQARAMDRRSIGSRASLDAA